MESSIMDTADVLADTGRNEIAVGEGASPIQHRSTMALMNGVTVTIRIRNNNNNNIVDEDDDKCSADKDGSDLRAIDFVSGSSHHSEPPSSVLDYGASAADDDNDAQGMMMVDSIAETEIAISNSSNSSSASSDSSSSSSTSDSSNSSSGSSSSESATNHPDLEEVEADGAGLDETKEKDEDEEHEQGEGALHEGIVVPTGVDESTSDKIMHTDDDPLLTTINALMNGAGGIEAVNTVNTPGTTVSTDIAAAVAAVAVEMKHVPNSTNDELETDRNYQCTYCGKLFTRSNTLSYHLKVHTGERPFKCKHCSKAFREQYRLMKHLKTHYKYRNRRIERGPETVRGSSVRAHLHRKVASSTPGHPMSNAKEAVSAEEDGNTGDSERFFKTYDLPEGTVMKLEPEISLTDEGMSEVPDADAMLTEEVEVMDEPLHLGADEVSCVPEVPLTDTNDIRHQIIEERIKSLQREVHLVNQNLNRMESKVDGLTKIISLLLEKFEDDTDVTQTQQHHQALSETISTDGGAVGPISSLGVVAQQTPTPSSTPIPPPASPSMQQKSIMLPTTPTQHNQVHQQYTNVTTVGNSAQLQQTNVPKKDYRSGSTHYYQFAEPTAGHTKATANKTATISVTPSPSPTPLPPQTQQLTLTTASASNGVVNVNQLLDTFPEIPELPIRTVSEFLDLNDHCTDNDQFLLQMMIRLHQEIHNSQPFQRNIKRMMEALVTYEVLCQFSWSGKSAINGQYTKYVFGNSLGIIDLLTKTLNLGKSAEEAEANQKPIFAAIQSFIKHSRQNMIRDSRKRRDPIRSTGGIGSVGADTGNSMPPDGAGTIMFNLNGKEYSTSIIKSEQLHHQQTETVHPF